MINAFTSNNYAEAISTQYQYGSIFMGTDGGQKGDSSPQRKLGLRFLSVHFSSMPEQSMRSVPTMSTKGGVNVGRHTGVGRKSNSAKGIDWKEEARTEHALEQQQLQLSKIEGAGTLSKAINAQAKELSHETEEKAKEHEDSFWQNAFVVLSFLVLVVAAVGYCFPDHFEDFVFSIPGVGDWARSMVAKRSRVRSPFDNEEEVFRNSLTSGNRRVGGKDSASADHGSGSSAGAQEWGAAASSAAPSSSKKSTRRRHSAGGFDLERRGSNESLNPKGTTSYSRGPPSKGDLDLI
jgi:hypothetical protein